MSDQDGDSTAARSAPPLSRAISDRFQDFDAIQDALRKMNLESSNVLFAVDYSAANLTSGEETFGGKSLHALDPTGRVRNPYEEALTRLGRVLVEFDDDQRIQVSGFGDANTLENAVFSFTPDAPFKGCKGFHEIWRRYHEVTPTVVLGEKPANLAPVIRHAIATAREATGFHILLILASSQLAGQHQEETVRAIVDASMLPISIIVIGMGDGPWDTMKTLDDRLPHRQFDNFQFVNFQKVMHSSTDEIQKVRDGSEAALTSALDPMDLVFTLQILMELPAQFDAMCKLHLL